MRLVYENAPMMNAKDLDIFHSQPSRGSLHIHPADPYHFTDMP